MYVCILLITDAAQHLSPKSKTCRQGQAWEPREVDDVRLEFDGRTQIDQTPASLLHMCHLICI